MRQLGRSETLLGLMTSKAPEPPMLGGLLCAERTPEHTAMYVEGQEALFWSGAEECAAVCREALAQYMRFMAVQAPRSMYEGIYKLEPGCLLSVRGAPAAAAPPASRKARRADHRWSGRSGDAWEVLKSQMKHMRE